MSDHRAEALRQTEQEAEAYRLEREAALRELASNLAKERAVLDEAERTYGEQLSEGIKQARANLDQAEREFCEQADQAQRDFNAAVEEARRSLGWPYNRCLLIGR